MRYWKLAILFNLLAIGATYLLVVSGLDWNYFMATRNPLLQTLLFPAAVIGGIVPLLLPIVLYLKRERLAAGAVTLAGVTGWAVSSIYKAFTGRAHPDMISLVNPVQNSAEFHFGFLERGIFWGWPSSHTTVAFAMSVALIYIYRNANSKKLWVTYVAILYALYIGIGVSTNIHWLSDVVAGALIGSVIGLGCASIFKEKFNLVNKK